MIPAVLPVVAVAVVVGYGCGWLCGWWFYAGELAERHGSSPGPRQP